MYNGGVIVNEDSDVEVSDCEFVKNYASLSGCIYNGNSHANLNNLFFKANHAYISGVISNNRSSMELNGCRFRNNYSKGFAGVIFNYHDFSRFNRCIFVKNKSR